MEIRETWGIPLNRIEAFFQSQSDVRTGGEGIYLFGDCEIRLTALPERGVGPLRFPGTQVEFRGPERDTETIRRRFVLQFISAGA